MFFEPIFITTSDVIFFPLSKDILTVLTRKEKEAKIVPDPDIDTYMKVFLVADILPFIFLES